VLQERGVLQHPAGVAGPADPAGPDRLQDGGVGGVVADGGVCERRLKFRRGGDGAKRVGDPAAGRGEQDRQEYRDA
jgi:hypothetical protein